MMTLFPILSYNVRSFGSRKQGVKKRCDIRTYIRRADSKPELILLQEIHLGIRDCVTQTSQLHFKGGKEFWNKSKYMAETGKYRGGTGILVAERLIPYIEDHGVLISSRVQYITFRFSPSMKIGVMNVYGYNQPAARARM